MMNVEVRALWHSTFGVPCWTLTDSKLAHVFQRWLVREQDLAPVMTTVF
jgi:hypothetical protein